jgi:hypothetical protein
MNKKELKTLNKDLEIHLVDIINRFDPSKTNKYTKFLVDMFKKHLIKLDAQNNKNETLLAKLSLSDDNNNEFLYKIPKSENELESILIDYFHDVFGYEKLESLHKFDYHLKSGRIPVEYRDINKCDDWSDILRLSSLATIKEKEKFLEKEILKVYEDDFWLAIKPLTFKASLAYGAGTKWCTTSRSNKDYFYRYSRNGVLIYVISKESGKKFGVYYTDYDVITPEFSVWNEIDSRVDTIQTGIPINVMSELYNDCITKDKNIKYFSDEEYLKSEKYRHFTNVEVVEHPVAQEDIVYQDEIDEVSDWGVTNTDPLRDF